jgi:AAA+ superfamily predicted ATPase
MKLALFELFEKVEPQKPIEIANVVVEQYCVEIYLTNTMTPTNPTMKNICKFFGIEGITGGPANDGLFYKLSIPRVETPDSSYPIDKLLHRLQAQEGKSWVLGIGNFGPEVYSLNNFTHAYVVGASGYGKSSFFRYLLTQTLSFHNDALNYIVDPKQVDYEMYDDHPNVMKRVKSYTEWANLFYAIMIEIEVRKHYFSTAFEKAPANLKDYKEFKEKFDRSDIPEFKRMFIWIDEAHMIFSDKAGGLSFDSNPRSSLAHIARQARAFGIHLMISSQRVSDIASDVRAQSPNVFCFYNPSGEGGIIDFPERDQLKPLPGRMGYKFGDKKVLNIQTPFMSIEESIAASYLIGGKSDLSKYQLSDEFKDGFYRIKIHPGAFKKNEIIKKIFLGESIDNFIETEVVVEDERYSSSRDNLDCTYLKEIYSLTEQEQILEKADQKLEKLFDKEEVTIADDSKLKNLREKLKKELNKNELNMKKEGQVLSADEVDNLLSAVNDTKTKKKVTKKKVSKKKVTESKKSNGDLLSEFEKMLPSDVKTPKEKSTGEKWVEVSSIKITDNKENTKDLILGFADRFGPKIEYIEDLSWCMKDLSHNKGLNLCYKALLKHQKSLDISDGSASISFQDLALNADNERLAKKYINEINKVRHTENSGPLLIVFGMDGVGKRTLLEAISTELVMPLREYSKEDLLLNIEDSAISEQLKVDKECEDEKKSEVNHIDELVMFSDLETAMTFVQRPKGNIHPILYVEQSKEDLFKEKFFGEEPLFEKIKYLSQYNIFLKMDQSQYLDKGVFNKLVTALLKKYHFHFEDEVDYGKLLAKHGVDIRPAKVDALIERCYYRAKNTSRRFDYRVLEEILNDFSNAVQASQHKSVNVIKPQKTMDDLIVADEVKKNISDAVTYAKSISNMDYKFLDNVRKEKRLVMLFAGPPGTGKSMSAEVIANSLGKDLWVCSLARLQSAFVGGTEQILESVFQTAQAAGVVLLIDECDTFLKSRELDTVGEYSKKITNHLLNLIESYKGVLALTTNHADQLDTAFSRRIDVKLHLDLPGPELRVKILEKLLYPDAPIDTDVDLEQALKGIEISGGLIRNAVERAFMKMIGSGKEVIDYKMLRDSLESIADENSMIDTKIKRIGLWK